MELYRNLRVESVSRLEPTAPLKIAPEQAVAEAVELMRKERVGCLLVCDQGKLVGVFTERDLLCRVLGCGKPLTVPVREVMTSPPVTLNSQESIRTAIKRMEQGGYRHLPVVDAHQCPEGVLSVKRIVHYLVEHFPAAVYTLPPDREGIVSKPEGA